MQSWSLPIAFFFSFEHCLISCAHAFSPAIQKCAHTARRRKAAAPLQIYASIDKDALDSIVGVVAPLGHIGPYPSLSLTFPGSDGVTFDFLLDTAANINSLDQAIAQDLQLSVVSQEQIPLVGWGGEGFSDVTMVLAGDCQLAGLPPEQEKLTFVDDLTVGSMPYASPVGHGVLGTAFFASFKAVEFDWHGTLDDPPTLVFFYDDMPMDFSEITRQVPVRRLAVGVLELTLVINGVEIPAVLDTGSPVTVLTPEAAAKAGIQTSDEATYGYDIELAGGIDGGEVALQESMHEVAVSVVGGVSMGTGHVHVGNLPGLAWLDEKPQAVLGLDFLRQTYRMVLCFNENKLLIQELEDE